MSATETKTSIPTGTWTADVVHSAVTFEVPYMGIAAFSGAVKDFEATLADGRLAGAARIASLETKDENLHAHLLSPEFFDAERFPEVSFATMRRERERRPGRARGRAHDQGRHAAGDADRHGRRPGHRPVRERALRAQARDHDRPHRVRDPLELADARRLEGTRRRGHPEGRPLAGEGGVAMRILGISGSLRSGSHNTSLRAGRGGAAAAGGRARRLGRPARGAAVRPGRRRRAGAGGGRGAPRRGRRRRRRADRDAGVQLVRSRARSRTRSTGPRARSRPTSSATSRSS